jgi:hypothetical protein
MKVGEGNHGRVYTRKEDEGRPKRRCVQHITDDLQMSASDSRHLTYDRVFFRRAIKGEKFHQGNGTE